jgi:hypothetical protein
VKLTSRYTVITNSTPKMRASGMLRCGDLISPPMKLRLFHPSYAQKALSSAPKIDPIRPVLVQDRDT